MKTQVQFNRADGDQAIALLEGSITSLQQAKLELANKLNLPGGDENLDARLRDGDIDPASIEFSSVAE